MVSDRQRRLVKSDLPGHLQAQVRQFVDGIPAVCGLAAKDQIRTGGIPADESAGVAVEYVIDLVEFEPEHIPGLAFFTIQDELSKLLGRKVDLNTPGFLSRYYREKIQADAEVYYVST